MLPYDDIVEAVSARHLQIPIDRVLSFELDHDASAACAALAKKNFDFGLVRRGGEAIGRVSRLDLSSAEAVGDVFQPIESSYFVSAESPVSSLISWLSDDPWRIVVSGNTISGIVTPSDLNNQSARAYFYLLLSDLEIQIANDLRSQDLSDDELLRLLPADRAPDVRKSLRKLRKLDIDSHAVSHLGFSDLLQLAKSLPEIDARFMARSTSWPGAYSEIVDLRNAVMHPARSMVGEDRTLGDLLRLDGVLRALLTIEMSK